MSLMLVGSVALFFLVMGVAALVDPQRVAACFGTALLTRDGRNEVRAVYGGFGIGIAVLLAAAPWLPGLRVGILTTCAVALVGMAGGRVFSTVLEGSPGFFPWLFFALELGLAAALVLALGLSG